MARRKLQTSGGDPSTFEPDITAAGGVVVKREGRRNRIAVIHRPKYMDWSLPKGKLEKGESFEEAALREVHEETGFKCKATYELPPVTYLDRKARSKLVRYWLMTPGKGKFAPHDEVDELRWLTSREARKLLTYDHDRELVAAAMRLHRRRRFRPGS